MQYLKEEADDQMFIRVREFSCLEYKKITGVTDDSDVVCVLEYLSYFQGALN